jgi:16S rRNA (cytosine967-C5)-methyltransferase
MRVFEQDAYADRAFRARARGLAARDRALAMRLAYGAVQRKGTLDHLAAALAERPLERLDPPVRAALRLGLYELLYTGGAPERAVVGDAVELAKGEAGGADGAATDQSARAGPGARGRGRAGLVNAVLRRAVREAEQMLAALDDATLEGAAIVHSHPRWIAALFWEELGAAGARALMAADNEPAELALRANTLRTDAPALAASLPVTTRRDPDLAEALVVEGPFAAHDSGAWRAGELIVQSRAAMLVGRVLGPRPGQRVLDLCAAPGGKTTHLAALMEGSGEVVAVERHAGRAAALERTAARAGAGNVTVAVGDARSVGLAGGFDRVLVDPPCSGLGTLQGHPDLRWRMTPERVAQMAVEQMELLEAGAAALRPRGLLVYSTCTISPAENELLVARFLRAHPDFALAQPAAAPRALRMERALAAPPEDPYVAAVARAALLTLPHRDGTAGFFVAALRRS